MMIFRTDAHSKMLRCLCALTTVVVVVGGCGGSDEESVKVGQIWKEVLILERADVERQTLVRANVSVLTQRCYMVVPTGAGIGDGWQMVVVEIPRSDLGKAEVVGYRTDYEKHWDPAYRTPQARNCVTWDTLS